MQIICKKISFKYLIIKMHKIYHKNNNFIKYDIRVTYYVNLFHFRPHQ